MSYVYNTDGSLPDGKVDAYAKPDSTKILSANNWNTVLAAVKDLRASVVSFSKALGRVSDETTGALTLYVDSANGNDANDGLAAGVGRALATLPVAVTKVPRTVRHPVFIEVSSGNYKGAVLPEWIFSPADDAVGAYVVILGTLISATITGDSAGAVFSATAGSDFSTSWGTLTKAAGINWTASALRSKAVEIVSGTGAGQVKQIHDNTTAVLTIAGGWAVTPDATSQFKIRDWGTVINDGFTVIPLGFNEPASGLKAGFQVLSSDNSRRSTFGAINICKMKFTTTFYGIWTAGACDTFVNQNSFATSRAVQNNQGAKVYVKENYYSGNSIAFLNGTTSQGVLLFGGNVIDGTGSSFTGIFAGAGQVSSAGDSIKGTSSQGIAVDFQHSKNGASAFFGDIVDGCSIGFKALNCAGRQEINNTTVKNCGVGVSAQGNNAVVSLTTVAFTSNTAVVDASRGASVRVSSDSVFTTNTGDIVIDGAAAQTIATLRGATPKHLKDSNYFTKVFE